MRYFSSYLSEAAASRKLGSLCSPHRSERRSICKEQEGSSVTYMCFYLDSILASSLLSIQSLTDPPCRATEILR